MTKPLWKIQLEEKQKREEEMKKKEKEAKDRKLQELLGSKPSPGLKPEYYKQIATLHARGSNWTEGESEDGDEWNMFRRQIKQRKARGEKLKFPIKPTDRKAPAGSAAGSSSSTASARPPAAASAPSSASQGAAAPAAAASAGAAGGGSPGPTPASDASAPPVPPSLSAEEENQGDDLESESWESEDEEARLPPIDCSNSGTALLKSMCAKEVSNDVVKSHSDRFSVGYADTRGTRKTMEDRMAVVGCFIEDTADYFAVYDGHGGTDVANYVCDQLHARLYEKVRTAEDADGGKAQPGSLRTSLATAFTELQTDIEDSDPPMMGGSTCAVAMAYHDQLYAANCGDARCVLVHASGKVQRLSHDHKPHLEDEKKRIEAEGGFVTTTTTRSGITISRVCGAIAVSRAFGDVGLQPFLIADPFVAEPVPFGPGEADAPAVMILACDGLWDVLEDEEVGEMALSIGDPEKAAVKLRNQAYASGSTDNISVMVIHFPGHAPAPPPPL